MQTTKILIISMLVMLMCTGFAGAAKVEPVFIDGNPTCSDFNFIGFKVEAEDFQVPTVTGTYYLDASHTRFVTITTYCVNPVLEKVDCGADDDPNAFDWTSNFPVDAVIVKGGSHANMYVYSPTVMGDDLLTPPFNPSTDKPFGLSHVDFCDVIMAPEFPAWFISFAGITLLLGLVISFRRK